VSFMGGMASSLHQEEGVRLAMQWPGKALETLPDMRGLPALVGVMSASKRRRALFFYGLTIDRNHAMQQSAGATTHCGHVPTAPKRSL
jgi:hypothetical protein